MAQESGFEIVPATFFTFASPTAHAGLPETHSTLVAIFGALGPILLTDVLD